MKVLLIEDDALTVELVKDALKPNHYVTVARSGEQVTWLVADQRWDLALVDLNLDMPMDGLKLIPLLKQHGIFTVVVSSHEEEQIIEQCYEAGCDDYYAKGQIVESINQLLQRVKLIRRSPLCDSVFEKDYLTQDEDTKTAAMTLMTAVNNASTALIMGETGTGKSELVKTIFKNSSLKGQLVELNCAGLPKDLIESELFGFEKGSFTGADKSRIGKVMLADQGILFLDEIGCLPIEVQAKFLKVLEEKKFYPLGSLTPQTSNFRLVAATNEDLFTLVSKGLFRADLLQRICGSVIQLKPLRQREADIWYILKKIDSGARRINFSAEAKHLMRAYAWPGNIRELIRFQLHGMNNATGRIDEHFVREFMLQHSSRPDSLLPSGLTELALISGLDELTEKIREAIIRDCLCRNNGNMTKTLKDLSISTRQFYKYQTQKNEVSTHAH
jgi:DNA-binding NtrC family response regulator